MSDLAIVSINKHLCKDIKHNVVKKQIIDRILELGLQKEQYKNNQELLLLICNLIEHLIVKKDDISKKELAIEILTELYSMNACERQAFEANIEFLFSTKMIRKVSRWKLFCSGIKELFFSNKKK
jgi:hypothetical protein